MFRRFAPALMVLACFILDTTVLPIVYDGVYAVPMTVVAVLLIGMLMGRMRGLLYGTIGGLLIEQLGRLPEEGDSADAFGVNLKAEKVDKNKIESIRLKIIA